MGEIRPILQPQALQPTNTAAHMQNEYSLKPPAQTNADGHQEHPRTRQKFAATGKPEMVVSVGMT